MTGTIDLEDAVDVHTHCGPSPFKRRVDAYDLALKAAGAGMDAVVFKEHFLPTAYGVPFVEKLLSRDGVVDFTPIGSVTLNYCNGGFNPFMVQMAIEYGARVIWAPTIDARNHGEKHEGIGSYAALIGAGEEEIGKEYEDKSGLYALEEDGELTDDVRLCIEKIAENDVALFIGHLSYPETKAMVEYAADLGHEKLVIDHPNFFVTDFDASQQAELVDLGAYMNFPYAALGPKFSWLSPDEFYGSIREVGVENAIVCSDVGQPGNPNSPEALRLLGEILVDEGLSVDEYRSLVEYNPKDVLGL